MSSFHECPNCGNLIWTNKEECHCKPHEYQLKSWGDENRWETYWSSRKKGFLAEEIVEAMWERDPYDPSHVDETVIFRDIRGCTATFHVSAEATVDFSASEVKP